MSQGSRISPSYRQLFREGRATLSIAILLSVSLVALDVLIVNTVLPTILRELGGLSFYAWAIGAYSLGNFITIPIFSTLVAKIGGRISFLIAVITFLIGAIIAATALTMHFVVLGRLVQGLGAGGFFAIPFAIISLRYPPDLQPRAVGLVSAVWGSAAVGGPLLGAAILNWAGWQWVFWFNLPAGLLILILGLVALRGEPAPVNPKAKVNWLSPLLFALSTGLFLEALDRPYPYPLFLALGALVCFVVFLKFDRRQATPIIPRDAWSFSKPISIAFVGMAAVSASFGAAETYLPLILQGIWEASPLEAGLILTVGSVGWSFTSVYIARFANYPRRLSLAGTLMVGIGAALLLFILYGIFNIYWVYLAWLLAGIGIGQVVPTYNTLSIDVADDYPSGVATGSLLLALTWGFSVGPPLAGLTAKLGFEKGFNPDLIGFGPLPPTSLQALQKGGLYALATCFVLAILAFLLARRMPHLRIRKL